MLPHAAKNPASLSRCSGYGVAAPQPLVKEQGHRVARGIQGEGSHPGRCSTFSCRKEHLRVAEWRNDMLTPAFTQVAARQGYAGWQGKYRPGQ